MFQNESLMKHMNGPYAYYFNTVLTSGFYTSRNNLALKRPSGVTGSDQCRVWDEEFRVTPDHNLQGAESSAVAGRWSRETLTPSIMSMLASKCPNLEELHLLCINFNGKEYSRSQNLICFYIKSFDWTSICEIFSSAI